MSFQDNDTDISVNDTSDTDDSDISSSEESATESPRAKKNYRFHKRRLIPASDDISENDFQKDFRMSKRCFEKFYEEVGPCLPKGLSTNKRSLKPKERLLAFLLKVGPNTTDYVNAFASEICRESIRKNVDIVLKALQKRFIKKHLRRPTREEAKNEADHFHRKTGFPKMVYAAIDGTHIGVQ